MYKKVIKILALIIIVLILVGGVYAQVRYEKEIKKQQKENGLLKGKKRIKWTPAIIYLFNTRGLKNEKIDTDAFNLPFDEIGGYRDIKTLPYDDIQKYILHCYYTIEEKERYIQDQTD